MGGRLISRGINGLQLYCFGGFCSWLNYYLKSGCQGERHDWYNGDWLLDTFSSILPNDLVLKIRGIYPPVDNSPDCLAWGVSPNGNFSSSSCYKELMKLNWGTNDVIWKTIWRWKGIKRVKLFLWLAAHERLYTNKRRSKWSGCSAMCDVCGMHVLIDCKIARSVRLKILPRHKNTLELILIVAGISCWVVGNLQRPARCVDSGY